MLRVPQIGLDVARALVYLHSRKILHLDIKSANVLLTRCASHASNQPHGAIIIEWHVLCVGKHYHWCPCWAIFCLCRWICRPRAALMRPCICDCRDGTAKVGDVGMAKIMAGDYVSGAVGTLAW